MSETLSCRSVARQGDCIVLQEVDPGTYHDYVLVPMAQYHQLVRDAANWEAVARRASDLADIYRKTGSWA